MSVRKIAIFGAGGFGREVACHINKINEEKPRWEFIGFFDDGLEKGSKISHYGIVLGGIEDLNTWSESIDLAIAIGSPKIMKDVVGKIINRNIRFPNIISPGIRFNDKITFKIGKGNIIVSGSAFSCDVSIGNFNIFNGSVVFGHDASVGSYNTFMGAVRISGEVTIGNSNFFGVGSIVLQKIKIGTNIRLGAGSVLIKKPKDGMLYFGIPAKKLDIS